MRTLLAGVFMLVTPAARAVSISPAYVQLAPNQSVAFSAAGASVTWQVNNGAGSGISASGVYTAPATPPSPAVVTVTAVSTTNPAETATATVTLLAAPLTGTTWYVATDGSDSNPGSLAKPFATLQHAADIAKPGDTVLARAGTYNKLVTLNTPGTASAPITFASYQGETAIIDGTSLPVPGGQWGLVTVNSVGGVIIEGFRIQNYTTDSVGDVPIGIYVQGAGDFVQLINNHITAITTTAHTSAAACANGTAQASNALGIAVYGSDAPAAISNLVISGNEVDHTKTGCSETVTVNGNVTKFAVLSNLIHDTDNIGFDAIGFEGVSSGSYDQARNGEIRGNLVYNITSYGNPDYGDSYGADGIYVDGGTKIVIEQNITHNTDIGIEMASENYRKVTSYVTARNNVVYNSNLTGMSIGGYDNTVGGSQYITIVNNTLFHNDIKNTGTGELNINYYATHNLIENNIVVATSQGIVVDDETDSEAAPATLDHNLYNVPGGTANAVFFWQGIERDGFATYRAYSKQDQNTQFASPDFVNTATPDLDITAASPAIGAAVNLGTGAIGVVDILGNPRIGAGGKVDQGAYQR